MKRFVGRNRKKKEAGVKRNIRHREGISSNCRLSEALKLPQLCNFPLILTCRSTNLPVGAPELNLEGEFPCFAWRIVREDREENREGES